MISNRYVNGITSVIQEKVNRSTKLYHGSHADLKILKPKNLSRNEKDYVFASNIYEFSLCFAGNKWNDTMLNLSIYNDELVITELQKDSLRKIYNTYGYVYEVPVNSFKPYKGSKKEYVSADEVIPIKKTKIDNILKMLKHADVKIYEYPDKPDFLKKYV